MYLIDTNILIYHFNNDIPDKSRTKINDIFINHFNVSIITKMEFLGFKDHTPESFNASKEFLRHAQVINISDEIAEKAIEIKRNHAIKLPDAIIAATAITQKYIIVTRNEKDFGKVDVNIYNPF